METLPTTEYYELYNALFEYGKHLTSLSSKIHYDDTLTIEDVENSSTTLNNIYIQDPDPVVLSIERYPAICIWFSKYKLKHLIDQPEFDYEHIDDNGNTKVIYLKRKGYYELDLVVSILTDDELEKFELSKAIENSIINERVIKTIDNVNGLFNDYLTINGGPEVKDIYGIPVRRDIKFPVYIPFYERLETYKSDEIDITVEKVCELSNQEEETITDLIITSENTPTGGLKINITK